MTCRAAVVVAVSAALLHMEGALAADDIDIARQALRDGLWDVARAHAGRADSETARLVILESYASEGRWADVKAALASWGGASPNPAFGYYRAVVDGKLEEAAAMLKANGSLAGPSEAKMLEADIFIKRGLPKEAGKLWREVVAMTNAGERAFAVASMNLGDEASLKAAYSKTRSLPLRRAVGLRLGTVLLKSQETAKDGAALIRSLVADSPDADGACDAFLALAASEIASENWAEARKTYADTLEMWPEAAKKPLVQQGLGEALMKLGRSEEAAAAFAKAEELSADNGARALALMRQGDALAALGREADSMSRYKAVLQKYPKTDVAARLKKAVEVRELEAKGRNLYRGYRFEEARSAFSKVAEADPSRRHAMAYLDVLCLYGLGLDDEAVREADALAKKCPDDAIRADATLWLAKFLYNRSEWKRSGELFRAFAEAAPSHQYAPDALLWATRAAFSANDFKLAVQTATTLVERHPGSRAAGSALIVQGSALIELSRFDEAVLVLERVAISEKASEEDRFRAQLLKADALFAMGADNPARYQAALDSYRSVSFLGSASPDDQIAVAFKTGRVLEKLKRRDEAVDQYYTRVVLAYREGRLRGVRYGDEARAAFSRAAFRLADDFESRGRDRQAEDVLRLVVSSDVPAANEALKRIERIARKGRFL